MLGPLCLLLPPALLQEGSDRHEKREVICGSGLLFCMWWNICIYLFWVHPSFETLMSKLPGLYEFPFKIAVMVWIRLPAVKDNTTACSLKLFFWDYMDGRMHQPVALAWRGLGKTIPVGLAPLQTVSHSPRASSGHPGRGNGWGMLGPQNLLCYTLPLSKNNN